MKLLWETHTALRRLRSTAIVARHPERFLGTPRSPFSTDRDPSYPIQEGFVDLCEPIERDGRHYMPLVAKALDLNCSLKVLFLRQEDPGSLLLNGGDLDGRIKMLCDALKMPDKAVDVKYLHDHTPLYCVMESDSLVAALDVKTGRLLQPQTDHPQEVHLVVEVEVRVLKAGEWNIPLLGF
ncbi:hypothetical protein V6U71_05955 [Sphingopyxis sp. J-6]|uniref:hypothetical protein n=1 Tax=Sphingopyxis sp. J-6 TaxID=3122054 RepID=UPI00398451A2